MSALLCTAGAAPIDYSATEDRPGRRLLRHARRRPVSLSRGPQRRSHKGVGRGAEPHALRLPRPDLVPRRAARANPRDRELPEYSASFQKHDKVYFFRNDGWQNQWVLSVQEGAGAAARPEHLLGRRHDRARVVRGQPRRPPCRVRDDCDRRLRRAQAACARARSPAGAATTLGARRVARRTGLSIAGGRDRRRTARSRRQRRRHAPGAHDALRAERPPLARRCVRPRRRGGRRCCSSATRRARRPAVRELPVGSELARRSARPRRRAAARHRAAGAVINQQPELVKVALPAVGVMDMLRLQKFSVGAAWTATTD